MTGETRTVLLWRHGQTEWNAANRFQGQTDVPLDPTGAAQAERAARLLAALRPDRLVASDLRRAVDTAGALASVTGLDVAVDPRLRERNGGAWEGLLGREIAERYPEAYAAWRAGEDVAPAGGESYADVAARAVPAVEAALEKVPAGGTLVLATHGGTARATIGRFIGLATDQWEALGPLANCNWSVLAASPGGRVGWRLLEHNAGTLPEPVLGDDR